MSGPNVPRVLRGAVAETLAVGILGTAGGTAAGHLLLAWIMPETVPDIGMLITVAPLTYVLVAAAGITVVAAAPLPSLRRLRHTDISSTLRVIE